MESFDVTIIGSGPGGYVAAIRCAQLGMKTALIEKYSTLGGTCLNVGCIPSKALLDSSEHFHNAVHNFKEHGIETGKVSPNLKQMIARKDDVVSQTCNGIKFLMEKNKVSTFEGLGSFVDSTTLEIKANDGTVQQIKSKNIIIATGSKPNFFPGMEPDKKRIITSTEALNLKEIPKKMIVIGGGVIGLELGSVYGRLGSQIEVVEFASSIIPTMDETMGKELTRILKKEGFKFHMEHKVQTVVNKGKSVELTVLNKKNEEVKLEADYCLVAVGRKPFTEGLGFEKAGVKLNNLGQVEVNEAEEEGVYVAELLAGQKPHMNYNLIPGVVYTWPEVASVGKTEKELRDAGAEIKIGSFPIKALGRARASMDTAGVIKIIADKNTDEVLGVHMIGPRAADLIMEAVVAMEYRASAEDIARICHPHPTYSEGMKEAALDATAKRALHI